MAKFFEGVLRSSDRTPTPIVWAESGFGNRARIGDIIRAIGNVEIAEIDEKSFVTTIDLPGLCVGDAIYLIDAILKNNYHSHPEVRGKLDAALYLLVNEAITVLTTPIED